MIPAAARLLPPPPLGERAARLRHSPLFSRLKAAELRALADGCETLEVRAGDGVVRQGDPAESLFIVLNGLLVAERTDAEGHVDAVGHLYKGEFFGEFALMADSVRSASVVAQSDAVLMRLSGAAFRRVLGAHPEIRDRVTQQIENRRARYADHLRPDDPAMLERLRAIVGGAAAQHVDAIHAELTWRWVDADTVLLREGEPGDSAYLLVAGRLQVFGTRADGFEFGIDELHPGDAFGEAAILRNERRNASVRALGDAEVLEVERAVVEAHVHRHRALAEQAEATMARHDANRTDKTSRARDQAGLRPSPGQLAEILATTDLAARNLRITWAYHRLSLAFQRWLGTRDANWACFGCRASYTAGYSIRMDDDLASPFARRVAQIWGIRHGAAAITALGRRTPLGQAVDAALRTVSDCISAGNHRIFAEIGTVMARFSITFEGDTDYDAAKLAGFLDTMPAGPPELGGQDVLRQGMRAWYEAHFATSDKARSEWILLGNLYIGVHEQTRVQSDLVEALEAPLRMRLGDEVGTFLARTPLRWLPYSATMRALTDRVESAILRQVGLAVRRLVTRRMMRIRLPKGEAWLGTPVPWFADADPYPKDLTAIALPELRAVLDQFGVGADVAPTEGASDWGVFADRMRFIIALFRARQQDPDLFLPPFDAPPD